MKSFFLCFALSCLAGTALYGQQDTTNKPKISDFAKQRLALQQNPHLFSLPIDTSIASVASMQEIRKTEGYRYIDFAIGKGDSARMGKYHMIRFIGAHIDGTPFSDFYTGKQVFSFLMGNGEVVKGLELGMIGMREGGRRRIIIASNLAYGAAGHPSGGIGPNETIMFDVELVKVE